MLNNALCRIGRRFLTRRCPSHLTCSPPLLRNAFASLTRSRSFAVNASPGSAPQCESLHVPCRSHGSIKLDIYRSATPDAPVLLYLPAGPLIPDCPQDEDRIISALGASSTATVVRVNYRASDIFQYPTPCHDVLFAFDWVLRNLIHDELGAPFRPKLGVCGELLGASLATMLALTECRRGLAGIGAAAVNNPVADWVFPDDMPVTSPSELPEPFNPDETWLPADEDPMNSLALQITKEQATTPKRRRSKKSPPPTSWQLNADNPVIPTLLLSGERDMLFRRSEDMFDRFASPIHFFRSPTAQLIYPQPDYLSISSSPSSSSILVEDAPLDPELQMSLNHLNALEQQKTRTTTQTPDSDPPVLQRCRSYARTFPPAGPTLELPAWRITSGTQSPLLDQASELAKMVRRSVARQRLKDRAGRARWHDEAEKKMYAEFAEKRVSLDVVRGETGLWSQDVSETGSLERVEEVGVWMRGFLERT